MKATVEPINSVQRRVKVQLNPDAVTTAFNSAYAKIQKKAAIKGFRPGKAPLNVIKKLYGQSVAVDVADDLVRRNLFAAIEAEKLRPVSAPVLETADLPEVGKEFAFSALVDIMPDLAISGYKGLSLSYRPVSVNDDILNRELERLQKSHAKSRDIDGAVAAVKGNMATISHTATKGGVVMGEFDVKGLEVEIGRGDLWHEIDNALVGMKAGETKNVTANLPAEYPDEELRNTTIDYVLTLDSLKELVLPNLDDEFAKDLGLESLQVLKDNISSQLQSRADGDKRRQLEAGLLEQLATKNQFDVPPSLVDQVIDGMIDEMNWQNDRQRANAKHNKELRTNLLDTAKRKACNTLILHEIIKAEKIVVTEADVAAHVRQMMGGYGEAMADDPTMLERFQRELGPQIRENLLFVKAVDFVISNATVAEIA